MNESLKIDGRSFSRPQKGALLAICFASLFLTVEAISRDKVVHGLVVFCATSLFSYSYYVFARSRGELALVLVSIGASLILGEIFLTNYHSGLSDSRFAKEARRLGVPFDNTGYLDKINELRDQGYDAWPAAFPTYWMSRYQDWIVSGNVFPLSGVSNKKTVYCNENGQWTIYQADEHGFRNPLGSHDPGEAGTVVLVGDSFTDGACVQSGEDIAGSLRAILPEKRFLSLGYAANGPLLEYATLVEYATPLKPEVVFWLYFEGNDLYEIKREIADPTLRRYLTEEFSQNLINRQEELDMLLTSMIFKVEEDHVARSTLSFVAWFTRFLRIIRLTEIRTALKRLIKPSQTRQDFSIPPPDLAFEKILISAKNLVSTWNGRLIFVYLPSWFRYGDSNYLLREDDFYRGEVLTIVRDTGIEIVDMHDSFSEHNDPLSLFPFRVHGHYTAEGYRRIAHEISITIAGDQE